MVVYVYHWIERDIQRFKSQIMSLTLILANLQLSRSLLKPSSHGTLTWKIIKASLEGIKHMNSILNY